jgi:hypothetical protein
VTPEPTPARVLALVVRSSFDDPILDKPYLCSLRTLAGSNSQFKHQLAEAFKPGDVVFITRVP